MGKRKYEVVSGMSINAHKQLQEEFAQRDDLIAALKERLVIGMTKQAAFFSVIDAQRYLIRIQQSLTPWAFPEEWPADVQAALETLRIAEQKLRRELKNDVQ